MKKTILRTLAFAFVTLIATNIAYAQFPNHVKGDVTIKLSTGIPFMNGKDYGAFKADGVEITKAFPITIYGQGSFDYAISNYFDIGIFGGVGMQETTIASSAAIYTISEMYFVGGSQLTYHIWGKARWAWDPYVKVGVGVMSQSLSIAESDDPLFGEPVTGLAYTARIGLNYYFTPTFGLHAEGGYGISYGTLGMQLRF